jgi:predicted  nucleic acid-binding Zn-ribbon protein
MAQSSFLSRWTGRPEAGENPIADMDRSPQEILPSLGRRSQVSVWSSSPSLERLYQEFDEQVRIIDEARRLLEERLAPFQRHLLEQRRNVDQWLKQLDARIKPLRQYLEGQGSNLERVGMHLNTELKEQFEDFDRFLSDQRQILERANRYLDEQPRPLAQFLEDEQRAIEQVFRDLEEKFEPLGRFLKEQQKLLESMTDPRVSEEFDVLTSYCNERHAAVERYATSPEHRPQTLFADLDAVYQKYKTQDAGKSKLLTRLLEQTRQADLRLRDSLKPLPRERDDSRPPRIEPAS